MKFRFIENWKLKIGYSHAKRERGFTLIELLVVIGILGVLAAALVATIDPFEQLKKASDANVKNTTVEYVDANIRYYTTHNALPWAVDTSGCGAAAGMSTNGPTVTVNLSSLTATCLNDLITDGEIKSAFTSVTGVLSAIVITGTTNSVTACFAPQSKAQRNDIGTKYNASATILAGCPNATLTTCYWCAQ